MPDGGCQILQGVLADRSRPGGVEVYTTGTSCTTTGSQQQKQCMADHGHHAPGMLQTLVHFPHTWVDQSNGKGGWPVKETGQDIQGIIVSLLLWISKYILMCLDNTSILTKASSKFKIIKNIKKNSRGSKTCWSWRRCFVLFTCEFPTIHYTYQQILQHVLVNQLDMFCVVLAVQKLLWAIFAFGRFQQFLGNATPLVYLPSLLVGKWLSTIFTNTSALFWCQMGCKWSLLWLTDRNFWDIHAVYCFTCIHMSHLLTRAKWNFPLNFRTMRKLSDLYSVRALCINCLISIPCTMHKLISIPEYSRIFQKLYYF